MIDTALNVLIIIGASAAIFSLLIVLLIVSSSVTHAHVRQWRDDRDRVRRIQRMNAEIQDQAASMRVCEDLYRLPARDPRVHG